MENICNSYRNIVERAIFAGVINEEHRDFYLSAIDDENSSYLSEVENKLNEKETLKRIYLLKYAKDCKDTLTRTSTNENDASVLLNTRTYQCVDNIETQLSLSMESIENRSILDFKPCLENEETSVDENESDAPNNQRKNKSSSNENKNAVYKIAKVMKKPRKDQIINFDVPIYKNLRYCNPSIKDFMKNGVSKPCHSHPDKNSGYKYSQKSRHGNIRNKQLISERNKNIPSSKPEKHLKTNKFYSYDSETDVKTYGDVDNSVKQKSVHTCSENKNSPRGSKLCSPKIVKKGSRMPIYCHKKHRTSSIRRLKVYDDVTVDKTDRSIKQKQLFNSIDHQILDTNSDIKVPLRTTRRSDKNHFRSKVAKSQNWCDSTSDCDAECKSSENESPLLDSCLKRSQNKDSGKFLNVKIICHLHPVEKMMTDNHRDSNNGDSNTDEKEIKEETLKSENHAQTTVEPIDAKDGKKTQLFSRILSTLKINKKHKKA